MPTFEFTVYLCGEGEDEDEAWENAVLAFYEDPGPCPDWHPIEVNDDVW